MIEAIHVYPTVDIVDHLVDHDGRCVCGPRCAPVIRADGAIDWMYVHHSLDGRERAEAQ